MEQDPGRLMHERPAPLTRVVERLRKNRLIPVIVIDNAGKAVALARALEEAGLPCAEITFRTPRALEAIEKISAECPSVLVGAGTILTARQAAGARGAGGKIGVAAR